MMKHSQPPADLPHSYPPASSTYRHTSPSRQPSQPSTVLAAASASSSSSRHDLVCYRIHPQGYSLGDARVVVSHDPDASGFHAIHASHKRDHQLEPVWTRDRYISENNEIVDQLIHCKSSHVAWTIHRPTRGWYLHLRSPHLPRGTAIAVRPANTGEDDQSVTPLTFNLTTRIRTEALSQTRTSLEPPGLARWAAPSSHRQRPLHQALQPTSSFSDVGLRRSPSSPHGPKRDEGDGEVVDGSSDGAIQVRATGRSEALHQGHARKRSAAGSGTHTFGGRRTPDRSPTPLGGPTIEEQEEDVISAAGSGLLGDNSLHPTRSASGGSRSSHADRPYSPAEPETFCAALSGKGQSPTKGKGGGRALLRGLTNCTFVLCDGLRRPSLAGGPRKGTDRGASLVELEGKPGWARWAWSLVPRELRPTLPLDTDKSFSLWWIDPPSFDEFDDEGRTTAEARRRIEVLRFVDQSGWWLWDAGTRGSLLVQEKAIEAIGLQQEFWIAIALAYLDFLETKDGYEAAKEG
ncbi:hypothetical protein ACQY0O_000359 [Thecaphora frezii]